MKLPAKLMLPVQAQSGDDDMSPESVAVSMEDGLMDDFFTEVSGHNRHVDAWLSYLHKKKLTINVV